MSAACWRTRASARSSRRTCCCGSTACRCELRIAGTPDPANPASVTQDEAAGWVHEPGVAWAGHVEDISDFWANAHVAALPSRREGLPKSLLEAAACGRPLIATDVPGCREIVRAGETGLLVPVDDAPRARGGDPAAHRLAGSSAPAMAPPRAASWSNASRPAPSAA